MEAELAADNGFLNLRKSLQESRDQKDVVQEIVKENQMAVATTFRKLKKVSERLEASESKDELKGLQVELSKMAKTIDENHEKFKNNKGSSFKFDHLSTEFALAELFAWFLDNVDAHAYAGVPGTTEVKKQTSNEMDVATSPQSPSLPILLMPKKNISLSWTTPDNYLIAVCDLTQELNHYCLTLALMRSKAAYQRITVIYKFICQIYDNLMNIKIARNCPLRRSYDKVKWQKREVQKICFDLMLIEEEVGVDTSGPQAAEKS